ncbi:MAG: glycosyltransferase, partial [Rhodospirillaceae bacterium]|nr:glycosyltransferase [Rhodospirillaceae bacterium]
PTCADAHPFISTHFADCVPTFTPTNTPMRLIEAITEAVERLTPNHASAATAYFAAHWSVDSLLPKLSLPPRVTAPEPDVSVDYIIRVGGRPITTIARALNALATQSHHAIRPILVSYRPVEGLNDLIANVEDRFPSITHVDATHGTTRSHSLWTGLRAVTSPYFGILDDDDTLQPNHIAALLSAMANGGTDLAYSGAIRVMESKNSLGRSAYPGENRDLAFLEPFVPERIARNNFIVSNAWLARRRLLDTFLLEDPELTTGEDFLLLLEMLERTDFTPSWVPSAEFYWREDDQEGSRGNPLEWQENGTRTHHRLMFSQINREALKQQWSAHGVCWENNPKRFVPLIVRAGDSLEAIYARYPERTISATAEVIDRIKDGEGLAEGTELRISLDSSAT